MIGRLGIVYSATYDCYGQDSCRFYLDNINQQYHEMKPEAKIVVYSVEHYDKQVLYGSAVIQLDGFSENFVSNWQALLADFNNLRTRLKRSKVI